MEFRVWVESSLSDLYQSAVEAFPHTTKRQYAVDPVEVKSISWLPYLGMRTLLCRALIESNGREYNSLVLFRGVNFFPNRHPELIEITDQDGQHHFVERMFNDINNVNVRCNCPDFRWRFRYYDHLDHSLYGNKGARYQSQGGPPANPKELPGMCKHLMKVMQNLNDAGLLN